VAAPHVSLAAKAHLKASATAPVASAADASKVGAKGAKVKPGAKVLAPAAKKPAVDPKAATKKPAVDPKDGSKTDGAKDGSKADGAKTDGSKPKGSDQK